MSPYKDKNGNNLFEGDIVNIDYRYSSMYSYRDKGVRQGKLKLINFKDIQGKYIDSWEVQFKGDTIPLECWYACALEKIINEEKEN